MVRPLVVFVFGLLLSTFNAYALENTAKSAINDVVNEYYQLKDLGFFKTESQDKHNNCRPPSEETCLQTACDNLGPFECDEFNEIQEIRRACRGSWGDDCLKVSMTYLKRFEYDDFEEMVQLANSCRGVYGRECIRFTCDRLGSFGCDDLDEITEVNRACSGARR